MITRDTSYNNRIIPEYTIIWPNRVSISTRILSYLYAHSWPKCAMLRSNDSEKQGHRYREVDFLVPFFHDLISFHFSLSVFFTHVSWGLLIKEIELVVQIAIVIHQAEMNSRA